MTQPSDYSMWIELLAQMARSGADESQLDRVFEQRPSPVLPADTEYAERIDAAFTSIEAFARVGRVGISFHVGNNAKDPTLLDELREAFEANDLTIETMEIQGSPVLSVRWIQERDTTKPN